MVEKIRSDYYYYCRPRHRYEKSEEEKCEDDIVASGLKTTNTSTEVTQYVDSLSDDVLKKTGRYYRYEAI